MSGFAWLDQPMSWFGKWFPRLMLVKAGYSAVWFGPGGSVRLLEAGLYCYWPITTEIVIVSTRCRTNEIAAQLCGREAVSVVVGYTIVAPLAALLKFSDVFGQMDDRTQAHLGSAYVASDDNGKICGRILEGLRQDFEPHGVDVQWVNVVSRGQVLALKNLNDWAHHSKAEL